MTFCTGINRNIFYRSYPVKVIPMVDRKKNILTDQLSVLEWVALEEHMSLYEMFEKDATASADASSLKEIAALCEQKVKMEAEVKLLEEQLKQQKEELLELTDHTIPEAMASAGVSGITLPSGDKVEIKPLVGARIAKDHSEEAHKWLRDNGFGDLIKNEYRVSFGRGEDSEAIQLKKVLDEAGFGYENKEGVHPQTLNAFVREQIKSGATLPRDLLGIYEGNRAVLKKG